MSNTATPSKAALTQVTPAANQKDIANHKKAAEHLQAAAEHHTAAAKHHENGHHEKAAQSTVKANGQQCLANECHKEDVKHHALTAHA